MGIVIFEIHKALQNPLYHSKKNNCLIENGKSNKRLNYCTYVQKLCPKKGTISITEWMFSYVRSRESCVCTQYCYYKYTLPNSL